MLSIERMRISMPAGMEHRGALIARQVADALSQMPLSQSMQIEHLSLPAMEINPASSDQVIAQQIAKSIHQQISASQPNISRPNDAGAQR